MRPIICESSSRWAAALRRELDVQGAALRETRTLDECRRELAASPGAWVILEFCADNAASIAQWIATEQRRSGTVIVVVTDRDLAGCELALRDCGAAFFINSPRDLSPLVGPLRERLTVRTNSWTAGAVPALPW